MGDYLCADEKGLCNYSLSAIISKEDSKHRNKNKKTYNFFLSMCKTHVIWIDYILI